MSIAAAEWTRGTSNFLFCSAGWAFYLQLNGCPLAVHDSVLPVSSSVEGGPLAANFCRVVCFPTCFTGWVKSFWPCFSSVTVFVVQVLMLSFRLELLAPLFLLPGFFCVLSACSRFSRGVPDFYNVLVFYRGGTLVCVCRRWCLQHVGSQRLFVALQGITHRFVFILFLGVWQSVRPNGSDSMFFFKFGGILAYMNCSMKALAAIPNASLASFWSSSRKSAPMREWRQLILSSSVNWLWILRPVWKKSSNRSNFSNFPSNVGIVVVSNIGNLESWLSLTWTLAEVVLFANFWRIIKIWPALIVAWVFSLRDCGWLVERFFFWYPKDALGQHYVTSS